MTFNRTEYLTRAARRPGRAAADEIQDVTLPSGAVFRLAQPAIAAWFASGRLPQALTIESFRHFLQGKSTPEQITDAHIDALAQMQRDLVEAAMVEPRLVPDEVAPGPGELRYRDLTPEDAAFIFQWGARQREVAQLASFRQNERVPAAGADGAEVRPAPVGDGRPD